MSKTISLPETHDFELILYGKIIIKTDSQVNLSNIMQEIQLTIV